MKHIIKYKSFKFNSINEKSDWTPHEILREITIDLYDSGLQINFPDDNKFGGKFYLEIFDGDHKFCKEWPENDMDWLFGKPPITDFLKTLDSWDLIRNKDYKLYGGGLGVNVVFEESGIEKLKV